MTKEVTLASQVRATEAILKDPRFWTQSVLARKADGREGKAGDKNCAHCLVGAASVAIGCNIAEDDDIYVAVRKSALGQLLLGVINGRRIEQGRCELGDIYSFNDAASTKHDDVMEVLHEAAIHAKHSRLKVLPIVE